MSLSGVQINRMAEAICWAYSHDELRRLVRICLDEDLDSLVAIEKPYGIQVFNLVEWADRRGQIAHLLRCAVENNPGNSALQQLFAIFVLTSAPPDLSAVVASLNEYSVKKVQVAAVRASITSSADTASLLTRNALLLPANLAAIWRADWSCNSTRYKIKQCSADVVAQVTRQVTDGYLPVEHKVTWAGECFNTDAWTFEVSQANGQERSGEASDNFLYSYWLGTNPGEANGVLPLDGDRGVVVHCAGPQKVEIEEGGGWTTVYEGNTCHDVKTGMLVFMNYTKRWLFTGDFEGKTYERAYFGDSEKLEQRLMSTNVNIEYVTKNY